MGWRKVRLLMEYGSVDCACGCGERHSGIDSRGRPKRFVRRGHNLKGADNYMALRGAVRESVQLPLLNPFYGRRHSDETKATLSAKASIPKPWLRGERNGMAGRTGASNPNWKGGGSPERQRMYSSGEWRRLRRQLRKRAHGRCEQCGSEHQLHIHHVKSWAEHPELRLELSNLVLLCRDCHIAKHRREVRHQ